MHITSSLVNQSLGCLVMLVVPLSRGYPVDREASLVVHVQLNSQPYIPRQRRYRTFAIYSTDWNIKSQQTRLFGGNLSVILNSQNPAADLSKKYVAISFHVFREAVAVGIIEPYWIRGKYNTSDLMTKHIPTSEFKIHCDYIHWRPGFHVHSNNRLDESLNTQGA